VTLQDRPTAAELLEAVREFVERDVMTRDDLPGRVAFHARVTANVLAIVERELTLGPELDAAERRRLADLLERDGDLDDLTAELARRIRDGSLDDRRGAVVEHVRASVLAKLAVANPGYADR
jgi:hypothetical protein